MNVLLLVMPAWVIALASGLASWIYLNKCLRGYAKVTEVVSGLPKVDFGVFRRRNRRNLEESDSALTVSVLRNWHRFVVASALFIGSMTWMFIVVLIADQ